MVPPEIHIPFSCSLEKSVPICQMLVEKDSCGFGEHLGSGQADAALKHGRFWISGFGLRFSFMFHFEHLTNNSKCQPQKLENKC